MTVQTGKYKRFCPFGGGGGGGKYCNMGYFHREHALGGGGGGGGSRGMPATNMEILKTSDSDMNFGVFWAAS